MKRFFTMLAISSGFLLVPAVVFASAPPPQDLPTTDVGIEVTAETSANTTIETPQTKPPVTPSTKPVPRPTNVLKPIDKQPPSEVLKKIRENASSTSVEAKARLDAAQNLMLQRKADVQTMLERKRMGLASTTAQLIQKREEIRQKIEDKRATVLQRIEDAKTKAREKFGEAVQRSVGNIVNRLSNAVEHLNTIATRIDTKIKEYESQGRDMSVSVGLLAEAQTAITAAQDKISTVGTVLTTALGATDPKAQMPTIRAAVKAAEDALKAAKEALHKALESTKTEAQVEASVEASATVN
jgi:hypothetical protein